MSKKRGLGKGLGALLQNPDGIQAGAVTDISIDLIRPNPYQPRREYDNDSLDSLTESIRQHGVIQPIIVKAVEGGYELIAGERRYRASRLAEKKTIPAIIRDEEKTRQAVIAIIENLEREDLNPIDEAQAFKRLMEDFKYTQKDLSQQISRSRSYIANAVRILSLSDHIISLIRKDKISMGHAKVLLSAEEDKRDKLADKTVKENLSVRELERIIKQVPRKKSIIRDVHLDDFERELRECLERKIKLIKKGKKYTLTVEFHDEDDLQDFYKKIR